MAEVLAMVAIIFMTICLWEGTKYCIKQLLK